MDEQKLSQLLDKKLKGITTDISAIEARMATIEDKMVERLELLEIRDSLRKLEKRLTAVEGQIEKKVATKKDLEKFATKKDLKGMEKRLSKKFDELFDYLDKDVLADRKRITALEGRVSTLETQAQTI